MNKEKRVFTVKFDLVQNINELIKIVSEEDIKKYQENEEECNKEFMEYFKSWLMKHFDAGNVSWIENVEVEMKNEKVK